MTLDAAEFAQVTSISRSMINEALQNLVRGTGGAMIPTPLVRPGVIGDDGDPGGLCTVKIDGDLLPISATNATGAIAKAGTRVLVSFIPPHGVYVTSQLGGGLPWSMAWGALGYVRRTSNQSSLNGDMTGLSVAVNIAAGGRRVRTIGFTGGVQATSGATSQGFAIIDNGSTIQTASRDVTNGNAYSWDVMVVQENPPTGAHTYKLNMTVSAGTLTNQASTSKPSFILVEDIGPVPQTS